MYIRMMMLAVVGLIGAIAATPFTGGVSAVAIVGCIGIIASGVGLGLTCYDAKYAVDENQRIINMSAEDRNANPGLTRFYAETSGYSSYVKKHDWGEQEENDKYKKAAEIVDTVHTTADVVSVVTSTTTTFGTKTLANGKSVFDFSGKNIKSNVVKNLGLGILKQEASGTAYGQSLDIVQDGARLSAQKNIISFEAKAETLGNYKDASFTFQKVVGGSEYATVIASDGTNIARYSEYASGFKATSTAVDINMFSMKSSIVGDGWKGLSSAENAQKTIKSVTKITSFGLNTINSGISIAQTGETDGAINQAWKTTTVGYSVDKYVLNYDDSKNEWHFGGSNGQKVVKWGKTIKDFFNN